MTIQRELIDELLKDYETPQDILGEGGLLKDLTKAVIERCLETELDTHLGYPKHGLLMMLRNVLLLTFNKGLARLVLPG
jgi:hypothetical protein